MSTDKENIYDLIYQVVRLIPRGRVTTYGAIAHCIGLKSGARMVGYALSSGVGQPGLPAHRVVNRIGVLTGKHHFGDSGTMQQLLEEDGITVEEDKIVGFSEHFWDPAVALDI